MAIEQQTAEEPARISDRCASKEYPGCNQRDVVVANEVLLRG